MTKGRAQVGWLSHEPPSLPLFQVAALSAQLTVYRAGSGLALGALAPEAVDCDAAAAGLRAMLDGVRGELEVARAELKQARAR